MSPLKRGPLSLKAFCLTDGIQVSLTPRALLKWLPERYQ